MPKKAKQREWVIATRASDQLGQALERFRKLAQLSQQGVAESAGLRQATISKVEKGIGTTEINTIYAVCAALGLELVIRPRMHGSQEFDPASLD